MRRLIRKPKLCRHKLAICPECIIVTDAGKRMSDVVNGLLTFNKPWEIRYKWMAFALSDGHSDNVLYDTRQDAIDHQLDERFFAYVCFMSLLGGATPKDCEIYLEVHRQAYDSGMRLHEPDAPQMIMSTKEYDGHRFHG
jgi:hypothetical protein